MQEYLLVSKSEKYTHARVDKIIVNRGYHERIKKKYM
jgi:hypothetical protein